MKNTPLQIRFSPQPLRETTAWLIPGNDPQAWLAEVAGWRVPHAQLRFHPLPRSRDDRSIDGVLVSSGAPPTAPGNRCIPYGIVAGRMYLPIEARFEPAVSDDELQSLLSAEFTYVWSPRVGLIAFEAEDIQTCADLIAYPQANNQEWNGAERGVVLSDRLISLTPDVVPTIEFVMQQGRDDIGDESGELGNLPPSPNEPTPGVINEAMRRGQQFLAGGILSFVNNLPRGNQRTFWDNVGDWAQQRLDSLNEGWNSSRNREINRLLNMLDSDPDRGLRHALPIGGDAHRGIAPPTNHLGTRDVNFNLGGLGGGGAADHWNLPYEYQQRLITRYRELANRELNIGRHRRAAYIFAQLLSDYQAAAAALTAGNHWREAAVLYSQKLNRPLDAARCLENGGLWNEAIEQYEGLREFEKVGDLYAKLEQTEQANEHYRTAASDHINRGDRINAARIHEHKLDDVDEAIDVLSAGWPQSTQATECVSRVFELLGKLGRHDDASHRLARFASTERDVPHKQNRELVEVIAHVATNYPDREIKTLAVDCTQRLVASQLSKASATEARQLLINIAKLAPQDRLLQRDCQRYPSQFAPQPEPKREKKINSQPRSVRRLCTMRFLQGNVDWQTAKPLSNSVFLAGVRESDVIVARIDWSRPNEAHYSTFQNAAAGGESILLEPNLYNGVEVLLHVIDSEVIERTEKQATPTRNVTIGPIANLNRNVIGACLTRDTKWFLESSDYEMVLAAYGVDGAVLATRDIPFFLYDKCVPMFERGGDVYVAGESEISIARGSGKVDSIDCDGLISDMVASAPQTRLRIAVSTSNGGLLICPNAFEKHERQRFATEMENPVIGFTHGGYLVATDDDQVEIYSTRNGILTFHARHATKHGIAVAIIASPNASEFGVLFPSGEIEIYEVS